MSIPSYSLQGFEISRDTGEVSKIPPNKDYKGHKLRWKTIDEYLPEWEQKISEKIGELEGFDPEFSSQSAKETFEKWKNERLKRLKLKQKLPPSIKKRVLQKRIAKIADAFFPEKGPRKVVLGCVHAQSSSEQLVETNTVAGNLYPKESGKGENHTHKNTITIDYRKHGQAPLEVCLDDGSLPALYLGPEGIPDGGPDFSTRNVSFEEDFLDFSALENLDLVYAERLPPFEVGLEARNLKQIKAIFQSLKKGGVFLFDLNIDIGLLGIDFDELCLRELKNEEGYDRRLEDLAKQIRGELMQNPVFRETVLKRLRKTGKDDSELEVLAFKAAVHQAEQSLLAERLAKWREKATELAIKSPGSVKVHPEEVLFYFRGKTADGSSGIRSMTLLELEEQAKQNKRPLIEQTDRDGRGLLIFRKGLEQSKLSDPRTRDQTFALFHQANLFSTIGARGDAEKPKELLRSNLIVFKRALQQYFRIFVEQELKEIGFSRVDLELFTLNEENKRPNSVLVACRK